MITSQLLQVRMINTFRRSLIVFSNHDSFTANPSLSLMGRGRKTGICKEARVPPKRIFFSCLEHKTFQQSFCVAIRLHLLVSCVLFNSAYQLWLLYLLLKSYPIMLCLKGCTFRITLRILVYRLHLKPNKLDEDDLSKTYWTDMRFFVFLFSVKAHSVVRMKCNSHYRIRNWVLHNGLSTEAQNIRPKM